MSVYLSIRDFGAVGDGVTDDTAAIQAAIDKGAETGRTVYFDPGHYSVNELHLHMHSNLKAEPEWGFGARIAGNTTLEQRSPDQKSVLNVSQAQGATIDGLSIMGNKMPGGCCGILCDKPEFGECTRPGYSRMEDAFRIERTRVAGFTGHAVYLNRIWCFSIRHCMFCFSDGDGLRIYGWDAFISDNWFSGNGGAGFYGDGRGNCSVTMTGNRIEWNRGGGIVIDGGSHYNITGNYIDRSGKAGIRLAGFKTVDENGKAHYALTNTTTCTGNIIYRSGKFAENDDDSCHIFMSGCAGITCTGNSLCIGRDDGGRGEFSPKSSMIIKGLAECIVTGNTMFCGSLEKLIDDRGGHVDSVIKDNVGSLVPEAVLTAPNAGLPTGQAPEYRDDLQGLLD